MSKFNKVGIAFTFLFTLVAMANTGPRMRCRVVVPKQYRKTPWNPPPNGQPEPIRYTTAYEAFWWNCVAVRAIDIEARCPIEASGTPAAAAGATDGSFNADGQIERLLRKYPEQQVQRYLRDLAENPEAKEKISSYFLNGPSALASK